VEGWKMVDEKVPIQIDKRLFGILKKVCDWSGWSIEEYVERNLLEGLELYLSDLSAQVPKAEELLNEFNEVKSSLNFSVQ